MKNIIFDGHIGSAPQRHTTKNGAPFITFSVGVSVYENGSQNTEWFNVTDYNMRDEENLHIGDYVLIQGKDFKASYKVDKEKGVVYLNQYTTATQINVLYRKGKEEKDVKAANANVSVYGGEASKELYNRISESATKPTSTNAPAMNVAPQPAFATVGTSDQVEGDDLPF